MYHELKGECLLLFYFIYYYCFLFNGLISFLLLLSGLCVLQIKAFARVKGSKSTRVFSLKESFASSCEMMILVSFN